MLGFPEVVLILLIFLLVFGGSRLSDLGRGLGKGIKNFKDSSRDPHDKNGQ